MIENFKARENDSLFLMTLWRCLEVILFFLEYRDSLEHFSILMWFQNAIRNVLNGLGNLVTLFWKSYGKGLLMF